MILLYKDEVKINGDRLGDNCISLLLEISNQNNISISLSHTPPFPDTFDAYIINTKKNIKTRKQFNEEMLNVKYGGM